MSFDVVSLGSCYVDINVVDYPFDASNLASEVSTIGNEYEAVPGGSAVTSCRCFADLGQKTAFVGMVGNDPMGELFAKMLEHNKVAPLLAVRENVQTNVSFNMTCLDKKHLMFVSGTANGALAPEMILSKLREAVIGAKIVYLGGCLKLTAFVNAFDQIVDCARKAGAKIVVDHGRVPNGVTPEVLAAVRELVLSADYYLPSHEELLQLWKFESIEQGLKHLAKIAPRLVVVVKNGKNGAYYLANGEMINAPAVDVVRVINLTGAGDSFNAGFLVAMNNGATLDEAVKVANGVAAAKISKSPKSSVKASSLGRQAS
jgi:sugar/nucleoside kinase (ribokinase family)